MQISSSPTCSFFKKLCLSRLKLKPPEPIENTAISQIPLNIVSPRSPHASSLMSYTITHKKSTMNVCSAVFTPPVTKGLSLDSQYYLKIAVFIFFELLLGNFSTIEPLSVMKTTGITCLILLMPCTSFRKAPWICCQGRSYAWPNHSSFCSISSRIPFRNTSLSI